MTLLGIKINPLVYFVIMGLMGLTIMFVQEKREKESWNNRDFEGIIISKKVTDEHALGRRNFLSVKVFKLDLEGDFKLLFFGGLLCS